jgi:hypothetical protein
MLKYGMLVSMKVIEGGRNEVNVGVADAIDLDSVPEIHKSADGNDDF